MPRGYLPLSIFSFLDSLFSGKSNNSDHVSVIYKSACNTFVEGVQKNAVMVLSGGASIKGARATPTPLLSPL